MANKRAAIAGCLSGVFDFFSDLSIFEALTLTTVMMINILQGTNHPGQPMVDGRSGRAGLAWLLVFAVSRHRKPHGYRLLSPGSLGCSSPMKAREIVRGDRKRGFGYTFLMQQSPWCIIGCAKGDTRVGCRIKFIAVTATHTRVWSICGRYCDLGVGIMIMMDIEWKIGRGLLCELVDDCGRYDIIRDI